MLKSHDRDVARPFGAEAAKENPRFANRYIWLSKAYHVWLIAA